MSASASIANGGRAAALARRRALSAGKSALPPATQRVRDAERAAPASETPTAVAAGSPDQVTCREHALARRAEQNRRGRGTQPPAAPVRPPRIGAPGDAPKIAAVQLQEGPKVTASRTGGEAAVTGAGRGGTLPVSGTQYIGADAGAGWRVAGPKVGRARTAGGAVVSGTLVRSAVPVTGDEGAGVPITGNADQLAGDDLTVRAESGAPPAAHSGGTLPGSRERSRRPALEPREGGVPVTGSAAGRTVRVTGDASGAWRPVTGDQYLAPVHAGAVPPDPAGGAKIGIEETWGQRRVTGIDTGRHALVSGDGLGAGAVVTGTPYQGVATANGTSNGPTAGEGARRLPQRLAAPAGDANDAPAITGSFASGCGKVTGNLEFAFVSRRDAAAGNVPARLRITGEGRSTGTRVTGQAWAEKSNVTGIDGAAASDRNPSRRAGHPPELCAAVRFKALANGEEPKHLVTGTFGYSSDSSAKVTLSGGAQG